MLSDATRVARLGMTSPGPPPNQALAERQATGAAASTSGQAAPGAAAGWAQREVQGRETGSVGQIELPSMPWSDWEIPGEQITICKRADGSDWELGSGAFGKVRHHAYECVAGDESPMCTLHAGGNLQVLCTRDVALAAVDWHVASWQ